jgi:hypothetical protein
MTDQFETFLSFNDPELAASVAEKLRASNIEVLIEKSTPLLDRSIIGNPIDQDIHIRLRRSDFQKGHRALEDYYKTQIDNVDSDYYLLSFSDNELIEIIQKPDEWGHFDYMLAQKLLKDRGLEIDESLRKKLKEDRIRELAEPEKADRFLLFLGYFLVIFLAGSIVSFFIGRHLLHSKRTLPDGQVIFSYRQSDRRHGNRIMIISATVFIIALGFLIISRLFDLEV